MTKQLVADFLSEKIRKGLPVHFTWTCTYCTEEHHGNFLEFARSIKVEQTIDRIRPDIVLSDDIGKPRIALEIVVSHPPEPEMLALCDEQNIKVVELHLSSDLSLDHLVDLITNPTVVRACRNPLCPKCNNRKRTKEMMIIHGQCWRGQHPIKVAAIENDYGLIGPDQFTEEELNVARSHGVFFRKRFIESYDREVWVNKCVSCPGFIGPGHLDGDYIIPARMGEYKLERFKIGYYCPVCDEREVGEEEDQWL